ncbi:MAG TPA: ElyC/SanA/YdcF family protein [Terriglobales bacterium]|nr:ElyC/SanA/YdcF family protein [Terriglobales bacterium]
MTSIVLYLDNRFSMPNIVKEVELTSHSNAFWSRVLWLLAGVIIVVTCFLRWGGELLVAGDTMPRNAEAAVILQGSTTGEKARIAGAMKLLQQGTVREALLSVPPESYWGEAIPPIAHAYLEKNYGIALANKVDFCIVGPSVDSTEQEAVALDKCVREHAWKSVIVVTSNYHSRRAGMIWRKTVRKLNPEVNLWVDEVPDPEFQPRGWWYVRLYAKTWFFEFTKLIWTILFG